MKVRGMSMYHMPHLTHAVPHQLSEVGGRHKTLGASNWLRASVFGVNDGLVSNASLILGVSGATMDPHLVLVSGTAGMLAGAFSMACGEYISVKSQREFFEKQIAVEKEELESYPELVAQGPLGWLVTRGILDRYLKDPDKRDGEAKVEKGLAWLADFKRRVQSS
jgi:hypothetical protein